MGISMRGGACMLGEEERRTVLAVDVMRTWR
jgi:hypothetical protein